MPIFKNDGIPRLFVLKNNNINFQEETQTWLLKEKNFPWTVTRLPLT